jgi:hypothetical protein
MCTSVPWPVGVRARPASTVTTPWARHATSPSAGSASSPSRPMSRLGGSWLPLHVAYVIWQGRIWSLNRDADGWRPYNGGGIYDPTQPTGGHFDHVHVSLTE